MPSIYHWQKSSSNPSRDSLHTPCSQGAYWKTVIELPAAREQAGQTATTEPAANSFAQVRAHSQAALVIRNLALSDENTRLKEVIIALRQTNAFLQQRLEGYEHRLHALEQSMVCGAHPDTPLIGVQNTTHVGRAHNTIPLWEMPTTQPLWKMSTHALSHWPMWRHRQRM